MGEEIRCLILGIEYDYSNISLSTAELETSEFDVLNNKEKVWEQAGTWILTRYFGLFSVPYLSKY